MINEMKKNPEIISKLVVFVFRFGNWIHFKFKIPLIKQILYVVYRILDMIFLRFMLGCEFPYNAEIGKGLVIYHPYGIIINPGVKIGNNLTIRHQVTIGNNGKDNKNPVLGNNIDIGAGAKIIGNIKVPSNSVIGANAVVNKTFKDAGIIIGVPAILKKKIKN